MCVFDVRKNITIFLFTPHSSKSIFLNVKCIDTTSIFPTLACFPTLSSPAIEELAVTKLRIHQVKVINNKPEGDINLHKQKQ